MVHNNDLVAIKLESKHSRNHSSQLEHEWKHYKRLHIANHTPQQVGENGEPIGSAAPIGHQIKGLPQIYHYGPAGRRTNAIIMELLGPNLEELFDLCNRRFTLKTVLLLAMRRLSIVSESIRAAFTIFEIYGHINQIAKKSENRKKNPGLKPQKFTGAL